MKKLFVLLLAALMVLGLTATSFAAPLQEDAHFTVTAAPRTVFGNDDAREITDGAIAKLVMTFSNGRVHEGTGFMYGTNVMATAAHCIYDIDYGYPTKIDVYLGATSTSSARTATLRPVLNTNVFIPSEWISTKHWKYDYAAIKYTSDITNDYFGLTATMSSGQTVTVSGYRYKEWKNKYHAGPIISVRTNDITFRMDTKAGQSGSPVYDSNFRAVGIFNYGANGQNTNQWLPDNAPNTEFNSGARITSTVLNFLRNVKYS